MVASAGTDAPWRMVLDNTIVGIATLRQRRFVWTNARMAEMLGYAPGELDGQSVRCLYVSQADYEEVGQAYNRFMQHAFYTHEHAQVCKDGSQIWCRISGRVVEPGRSDAMSVWVVQDLSDKKRAEDALRRVNQHLEQTVLQRTRHLRQNNESLRAAQALSAESLDKYRTLFSHLPLGVLVTNAAGEVVEVNRTLQQTLGAPSRVGLLALLNDSTRAQDADGQPVALADTLRRLHQGRSSRPQQFELRWLAGGGGWRDIAGVAMALSTRGMGAVFTLSDVTDQRLAREREHRQQQELAHAARLSLMGQMSSALAHELGQPLNACQSYLTGIRHRLASELAQRPDIAQALDKAMAHLDQAGQIIGHVRGFVSRHEPALQAVDLAQLLNATLRLLELPLRQGGVRVRTRLRGQPLPPAHCHQVEIQQVLVNLVMNAIEALQGQDNRPRLIDISVARGASGRLTCTVADNGPGVLPALHQRLFDPYVSTKPKGLGMGLMISRTLVESHGGSLRHTRRRGGGARFQFSLPEVSVS
ncbi:PAS domain-containing sensor histidine kinase [Hydrogenophaga defluvii]